MSPRALAALSLAALLLAPLAAADYKLDVNLDVESKVVSGRQEISWTNSTSHPADQLRFHLYFNAWRDKKSSFLQSFRWRERDLSKWRDGEWGSQEIDRLIVIRDLPSQDPQVTSARHTDLTKKIEYLQPDDGNAEDRTVIRVLLPEPVPPGGSIQIEIDFRTKVPRTFSRTGYRGDYFFLAHWFPKLGVFEEDGTWNCHQFIQTEFYTEFGDYDVRLRMPAGWTVGATGLETDRTDNGDGTVTHRYVQAKVHEFAWTASPRFHEFKKRFEHPTLKPVRMRLLLMPDHLGQETRYFAATEAALKRYGEWFGEYPYGHVTIVDPAYQSGSGGMEYPTFFTGGSRWLNPSGSGRPEGVTVHEAGHQFWYGLVANNEFEDAWLDEGLNTYSTRRTMGLDFSPSYTVQRYMDGFVPFLFEGLPRTPRSVSGLEETLMLDKMSRPSWQQGPGAYGVNSYAKPALMLVTLERYLGWETFRKCMSTFFERWKFKHPKPADFFEVFNEVSGQDLGWFWEQTYQSSQVFDYAVDVVDSKDEKHYIIIRRHGEAVFPVVIRVTFEDGETIEESWSGVERWKRLDFQGPAKLSSVEVDPDGVLALDINRTNNSWLSEAPARFAGRKWALKWMIWMQSVMEQFAFHM